MPSPKSKLPPPIKDIPPPEVGDTVQSFIDNDDVTQMKVKQQADGNFTVTPEKQSS